MLRRCPSVPAGRGRRRRALASVATERTASAVRDRFRVMQEERAVEELPFALRRVADPQRALHPDPGRGRMDGVQTGAVDELGRGRDDVPGAGRQPLGEEPSDQVAVVAEPAAVHPAAEQQQARVLDPAGGQHHQPCPHEAARAVVAPDLDPVHPAGILPGRQVDDGGVQQQRHVGRADELLEVALEAGGAVLEQRGLDLARRQGQGWRAVSGRPSGRRRSRTARAGTALWAWA